MGIYRLEKSQRRQRHQGQSWVEKRAGGRFVFWEAESRAGVGVIRSVKLYYEYLNALGKGRHSQSCSLERLI